MICMIQGFLTAAMVANFLWHPGPLQAASAVFCGCMFLLALVQEGQR